MRKVRDTGTKNLAHTAQIWQASNLRNRLAAATDAEWQEGAAWYSTAHAYGLQLSDEHRVTPRQACGIIAALSPQVSWDLNQRLADELLATDLAGGALPLSIERARAIAQQDADPLLTLGGPKVRSFYRNIVDPDRYGPVTIDRHALAILAGMPTPTYLGQHPKLVDRKYCYRIAAGIYRTVAREYGLPPHVIQAIAWVSHRNADYVPEF